MSNSQPVVVERGEPLSKSFIWPLQCRFYESLGIDAWLSGVIPSKITTNAHIARVYARMIAAHMADVGAENLTIVELGAGHGRFGFLCTLHLREMAAAGLLPAKKWTYVMTDVAERNIGYWQQHEALRPLVAEGVLDFARFEAGVDTEITLRESGRRLGVDTKTENLVLIANYFFDSLPIDAWKVEDGRLLRCSSLLTLKPEATCSDTTDAAIIEQLELDWECNPVESAGYADVEKNELVEYFRSTIGHGAFTLPVGAIDAVSMLESWSERETLLLVADKGYARESDLIGRPLPTMVQHGCFSFSFNFCALAKWFERRGGKTLLPTNRDGDLEVAAFVGGRTARATSRLDFTFAEGVGSFSPGDYHQIIRRCERTMPELRHCLSLIRLSCFEPQVFHALRRIIRAQLDEASAAERQAVRDMLVRITDNYFHLDEQDVPFAVGLVYQQLGDYADAAAHYRRSMRLFGDDSTALFNLATCLGHEGDQDEALRCVRVALELEPDYPEAVELRARLEDEVVSSAVANA
ncbi:MAG: tetratricopeptide repeat protein [Planctomycetia bacterium]|nr:tetratricopeptide repeat protein [Planctomycetia bacterium]